MKIKFTKKQPSDKVVTLNGKVLHYDDGKPVTAGELELGEVYEIDFDGLLRREKPK